MKAIGKEKNEEGDEKGMHLPVIILRDQLNHSSCELLALLLHSLCTYGTVQRSIVSDEWKRRVERN
jgi:hypothetical protein